MDVFESGIFYGKKLHPNKSEYANADAAATAVAGPTPSIISGGSALGKIKSLGTPAPTGKVFNVKDIKALSDQAQAQAATVATQPQVAPVAPPPPAPAGPFLGTFQFPQQQYYPECDIQQQGGASNKTLLYVAVGIAAVGLFIYYKKHNA
jgi:hypothetical protein